MSGDRAPGIGTPSAAASGAITANTLAPVGKQNELLRKTAQRIPQYKFLDDTNLLVG